jgi:soluble lytic murein transglycosylase-like protein
MNRIEIYKLIDAAAAKHGMPAILLAAQVDQESSYEIEAISDHGAMGLLQLMPATARELGLKALDNLPGWTSHAYLGFARDAKDERLDPEKNLDAGARYLRIQYDHFPEIPDPQERWKFALASYNGGRGHINNALRAARIAEFGLEPLAPRPGKWQTWDFTRKFLAGCDVLQICGYVSSIWAGMKG